MSASRFFTGVFAVALIFGYLDASFAGVKTNDETADMTSHPDPPCPHPCYINHKKTCVPPPCPLPPCVDRKPEHPHDCCEICPNGPNCAVNGTVIPYQQSKIVGGKNCTCVYPYPSPPACH